MRWRLELRLDRTAGEFTRVTRLHGSLNSAADRRVRYELLPGPGGEPTRYSMEELAGFYGLRRPARQPLGESEEDRTGMYFKPAMYYSVSAKSEHPEEAALLVDFLLNDPAAGEILLSDRGLPANTDVRAAVQDKFSPTDKQAADFLADLEDEIVDGPVVPPVGAGQVAEITRRINQEVLFGRLSPADAAKQYTLEVGSAIGS